MIFVKTSARGSNVRSHCVSGNWEVVFNFHYQVSLPVDFPYSATY